MLRCKSKKMKKNVGDENESKQLTFDKLGYENKMQKKKLRTKQETESWWEIYGNSIHTNGDF